MTWKLTGRQRCRVGWCRKLVMQIEEVRQVRFMTNPFSEPGPWKNEYRWRDARAEDLSVRADKGADLNAG